MSNIRAYTLRLPDDLRDWVMKEAEKNGRSMTKEIVFRLEQDRQEQARRREKEAA